MKKSKDGISTPRQIIETVEARYKAALQMDKEEKVEIAALAQKQAADAYVEKSNTKGTKQ